MNDSSVPCDEAQRPAGEATCPRPPCPRALGELGPEGSGSGSFSHELYNEVDFVPRHLAPHPVRPSPPGPAATGNAIEGAGPEPEPVFVDDFYYDYNFITFHEDLSYGPFEGPGSDPGATGAWTPPPPSSPAEPPVGTPEPAPEPPGAEEEWTPRDRSPTSWPGQAGHSLPPPSEQTPGNLLVTLSEDTPLGPPDLGLPSPPWTPASAGGAEATAAPGDQDGSRTGASGPSPPLPPRWESTNEVSEDEEEALHLPPSSTVPPLSSTSTVHSSPGPDSAQLWTHVTGAWEPALDGNLGPGARELRPTVGGSPPTPRPPASLPEAWDRDRDSPLERGTPALPAPGLAPLEPQTPTVPGGILLVTPTGLRHTPGVTTLSPVPAGPAESPSPQAPLSSVLLSTPAGAGPASSSGAPDTQTPDPSLAEEGSPKDLPPASNATWEVGQWSEASGARARVGRVDRALRPQFPICAVGWGGVPTSLCPGSPPRPDPERHRGHQEGRTGTDEGQRGAGPPQTAVTAGRPPPTAQAHLAQPSGPHRAVGAAGG